MLVVVGCGSVSAYFNHTLVGFHCREQSRGWWFETPSRSLWRHCNGVIQTKLTTTKLCVYTVHTKHTYDSRYGMHQYIDGLAQERRNSSALAMELRLSCTKPSIWYSWEKGRIISPTIHGLFSHNRSSLNTLVFLQDAYKGYSIPNVGEVWGWRVHSLNYYVSCTWQEKCSHDLTHWETKWPLLCWRQFQTRFLERKLLFSI